jgi:hypothetical protein
MSSRPANIKISIEDLMWLAGILEGDGSFGLYNGKPVISIQMTDEDIVKRAVRMWGVNYTLSPPSKARWKMCYRGSVSGQRALGWMRAMLPYMGNRRHTKISDILDIDDHRIMQEPPLAFLLDRKKLAIEVGSSSYRKVAKKYGVSHETIRRAVLNLDNFSQPRTKNIRLPPKIVTVIATGDTSKLSLFYWVAGLLEAEGSFIKGIPSSPGCPIVSLQMTDRDTVEKAQMVLGKIRKISVFLRSQKNKNHKDVFAWIIRGKDAAEVMTKLQPLMGIRRQAQITRALTCYTPDGTRVAAQKRADSMRTMTDTQVMEMWKYRQKGATLRDLGTSYGVDKETIRYAIKNLVPRILASTRKRHPKSVTASQ